MGHASAAARAQTSRACRERARYPTRAAPVRSAGGTALAAAALAAAVVVLLAPPALMPAHAQGVIGPGSEDTVQALLLPYVDEGEVVPGVWLVSIQIEAQRIALSLRDDAGAVAQLVLRPRPRGSPPSGPAFERQRGAAANAALGAALDALDAAVARNDDGSFRFADGLVEAPGEPIDATETVLAALLWLALLVALAHALYRGVRGLGGVVMRLRGWARARALTTPALALLTFALALTLRLALPFAPLHANEHAWEDAAVALQVDGEARAALRQARIYGPAYRMAQAAMVAATGAHFDGLAAAGAIAGALAAAFAALAARAVGGMALGVVLAAIAAASPLAARVAASESDLVVAQLLVALTLWAATRATSRAATAIMAAAVALLAMGHIVGPAFAAAAAALAVALRHRQRLLDGAAAGPLAPSLGPLRWTAATREALGLGTLLGLVGGAAGLLRLHVAWGFVAARLAGGADHAAVAAAHGNGDRLAVVGSSGVGVAGDLTMLLAHDSDYLATAALWLAVFALVADLGWRQRRAGLAAAAAGTGALAIGCVAMFYTSLLIVASVTDALRYQAVAVPALLVVAAGAPEALRFCLTRAPRAAAVLIALAIGGLGADVVAHDLVGERAGMRFADSQLRAWDALRAAVVRYRASEGGGEGDDAYAFIVVRGEHHGTAWPDAPRGRWSASGPTSRVIAAVNARSACAGGVRLPRHSFVWMPPSCEARSAGRRPCEAVAPFRAGAHPIAAGVVDLAQQWDRRRPPGEFLAFERGSAGWSLWRAGCPERRDD